MSGLLSVPNEIILAILSHLSLRGCEIFISWDTLPALTLACHRLYHLAALCLYRSIYIGRLYHRDASRIYDLLLRSVNGNTKLGVKAQSLVLK